MRRIVVPIMVALILAASVVLTARIFSDTAISIKNKGYVTVKGFAKQNITSDLGIFKAKVVEEDADLKAAYDNLDSNKKKVEAFLEKFGFGKDEVKFEAAEIGDRRKRNEKGNVTDERAVFILSQSFRIESSDVKKIEGLSAEGVKVLGEGVRLVISEPQFIYKDLDDLKVEMIGRATQNARERAQNIAQKGNFRLGSIASVRVGIFQITPIHSTRVSDYGINDTTSIEKEIKSVVEIQYFVK